MRGRGRFWLARLGWLCTAAALLGATPLAARESLPALECVAEQTGGFHDYPGGEESYEPALFHSRAFTLEENAIFMMNLAEDAEAVDLYLTLQTVIQTDDGTRTDATELECRRVRGAHDSYGYSCVNLPPSEMLLINARTLRFTRTAVGGWTFQGATDSHSGDSIFVEYGQCTPAGTPEPMPGPPEGQAPDPH